MKLISAPLEDVHQELTFTLQDDGGPLARILLSLFGYLYRGLHGLMLFALRRQWRGGGFGGGY